MNGKQIGNAINALELTHDKRTVCPGASERNDEMVASQLGFVLTALFDGSTERGFLTTVVSVFVGPVGRTVLLRVVLRRHCQIRDRGAGQETTRKWLGSDEERLRPKRGASQ